jgi:hypothetical protein
MWRVISLVSFASLTLSGHLKLSSSFLIILLIKSADKMMVVRLFGILGICLICLIVCVECLPKPQEEREADIEYNQEDEDAGEDSLYDDQQQEEEGQQEQDNYTDDDDDNNEEGQDDQEEET